jgi:RNA exonuclease 4
MMHQHTPENITTNNSLPISAKTTHTTKKRPRLRSDSSGSESDSHSHHHNDAPNAINKIPTNNRRRRRRKRRSKKAQQLGDSSPKPKKSEVVALDCEMVGVGDGGHSSSAARVTVIDWFGTVLLDEFIQQTEPVTDYRAFVSGITPQDLEEATMTLQECQELVLSLLRDHILVGHALKNDMKVLGITHPWWLTRDSAKYEPFMKVRFDDGILWPRKLKDLVSEKLNHEIQVTGKPHSPYEDASAALDLYRSVRPKWESVMVYKIEKTNQIRQQQQVLAQ